MDRFVEFARAGSQDILEAFITVANSLTRSLLRDHACFRTDAWPRMRPRGPPQGLGGTRYRTMSRQSEMVTSVRMSATIMAQRSDFADQRRLQTASCDQWPAMRQLRCPIGSGWVDVCHSSKGMPRTCPSLTSNSMRR